MRPLIPLILLLIFSCSPSTESDQVADSLVFEEREFVGSYLIGDGGAIIVPVEDGWEMRNELGETQDLLHFVDIEADTLTVYANMDKSIIFKMNPGHMSGMYYEPDEQWPVSYIGPAPVEETEEEELERIMNQRHYEDSIAYAELDMYDGEYSLYTESEGVNATLTLNYQGDRVFDYSWSFEVSNDEVNCKGLKSGTLTMDRTQHGFDPEGCAVHFNFNGLGAEGYTVELMFDDEKACKDLSGECTFSGTYTSRH